LCLLLSVAPNALNAQAVSFPAREARVDVVVRGATATVTETYPLTRVVPETSFEWLDDRCSRVGPMSIAVNDASLALDATRNGPWTMVRASSHLTGAARASLVVRYEVTLAARDAGVPILLPAAPLERADGSSRDAVVAVTVELPDDAESRVLLPRLERFPSGKWEARLLAIPSMLRVRTSTAAAECVTATDGTTGGLEWRFWIFAGTMGVWVPLYLWWFGRREDRSA